MRGGFLHNEVLLAPFERHFRRLGATVHREYPVAGWPSWGFVDLFAVFGSHRIVCEAELTPRRIANDFAKAEALEATWLLIVTPTWGVAKAVTEVAQAEGFGAKIARYSVLPLGPALQRIRVCFPLVSFPIYPETTNEKGQA